MNIAPSHIPRPERITLAVLALLSLALRAVCFFRYRFDSDEPQHLHVAWGWTAGLLQYRDVFDNHTPLFHMLSAPLLRALGERPDILLWMRVPMLFLFGVVLVSTYIVARRLWDMRTALWSVVLLSLFPPFFLKSLEYRNDNLWTALSSVALLILTARAPLTVPRAALAGLILGTALSVSLKTAAIVIAVAVTTAIIVAAKRQARARVVTLAAAAGTAFVLVPASIAYYFAQHGAWRDLIDCVFEFNRLPLRYPWLSATAYPLILLMIAYTAARAQRRPRQTKDLLPLFLIVTGFVFTATVVSFWPLVSPRDFLPVMPLLAIGYVRWVQRFALLIASALVCMFSLIHYADGFENRTDEHITMMRQVLRLTHPGEPLMDMKGETVYRRRPYYYMLETITRQKIGAGVIRDTIREAVVGARCHVAQADGPPWPPSGRAFLSANFLDMGRLRAAGQWISEDGRFTIAIPGEYIVIDEWGEAPGTLDGSKQSGSRWLEPGAHQFARHRDKRAACLWAPAFARGFSPFHLRDRKF